MFQHKLGLIGSPRAVCQEVLLESNEHHGYEVKFILPSLVLSDEQPGTLFDRFLDVDVYISMSKCLIAISPVESVMKDPYSEAFHH